MGNIFSNPDQVQKNTERLIMVSLLENLDDKGMQADAKDVQLHRTQALHKTEAAPMPKEIPQTLTETSSPAVTNEMLDPQVLSKTLLDTPHVLTCAAETQAVEENRLGQGPSPTESCAVQGMPCAEEFQGIEPLQSRIIGDNTPRLLRSHPSQEGIIKDNLLQEYTVKVKAKIERNKKYPQVARRKEIEGVVRVQFCISNDGRLKNVEIAASSGCKILDDEAVMSVKKASPFLCIPEGLKREELSLRVNIAFRLEG